MNYPQPDPMTGRGGWLGGEGGLGSAVSLVVKPRLNHKRSDDGGRPMHLRIPLHLPLDSLSASVAVVGFKVLEGKKEILEFIMHLALYFLFSPIFTFNTLSGPCCARPLNRDVDLSYL